MEKKLLKFITVVLMALTALGSAAQEFSVGDLMFKVYGSSVYCTGLTAAARGKTNLSVVIPSSVTNSGTTYRVNGIDANSFNNCTNIVDVTMKFGSAFIESNSFNGCTGITWVRLPSSIRSISSNAFNGCTALSYVYYSGFSFPTAGVASDAFPAKSGMNLYIPNQSRKTPAEYKAKTGFTRFANVYNSIYAYDDWFIDGGAYCIGWPDNYGPTVTRSATLTGYISTTATNTSGGTLYKPTYHTYSPSGTVPIEIDTIGASAFQGQTTLKTIDLTALTKLKDFGAQYENTGVQNVTQLVLPSSSFTINSNSFLWFSSLTAFELASGSNAYSIYNGCLYNKSQTTLYKVPNAKSGEMSYPSALTYLWSWCHANCSKITKAMLPYGVKTINVGAFANTALLDYVRIPSSVTNLSNDRVFAGTKSNIFIYCNMDNPPTVTASSYFGTNSGMNLYIPYGKESTYQSAGWTGFKYVNPSGHQAYDYPNLIPASTYYCYSVTSNASVTGADGNSYGGRARLVCHGASGNDNGPSTIYVPASVTIGSKTYVVNKIGEDAFNNRTTSFTVTGCVNVDTIGEYAFHNQLITSYAFTHKLRRIGAYAFDGASLTGTVALPYGVSSIGYCSFGHGKYSRLVVPSSVSSWNSTFCTGTTTLTELVLNKSTTNFLTTSWNFTDVPATCKILVPTGVVNQYKQNSSLSSRASYISAGAYDFAYNNTYDNGYYFMTVISSASTTYNGTTYAGKAKYVYHPNIKNTTSVTNYGFATSEYDKTVSNDQPRYLITEIGDSTLFGSKFTSGIIPATVTRIGQSAFRNSSYAVNNLVLPSGLTFIGHDAFFNSKITGEIKIPSSVTTIEDYAFNTSTLGSLFFPDVAMPTMGLKVWYSGIGAVWVPNGRANSYLTKANSWGTDWGSRLAPWIKPYATTQLFSSVLPTNLSGSNVNAYYASDYTKSDTGKEVRLTKINQAPPSTGMLLVDLTVDQETRISRPTTSVSAPATNYLVATPTSAVNVYNQTVGYYWQNSNPSNLRFVRPTTNYNTIAGGAYLKLSSSEASGKDEVYTTLFPKATGGIPGDVNGDGLVTAADVTALYDYMLNNDTTHIVNGDQTGDGLITAADVTAVYGVLLGN